MSDRATAHPPTTQDYYAPEPHIDPDGMCACVGPCCNSPIPEDKCICADCGGREAGCPVHDESARSLPGEGSERAE